MNLRLGNKHCFGVTYQLTEEERIMLLEFALHINNKPEQNINMETDRLKLQYGVD